MLIVGILHLVQKASLRRSTHPDDTTTSPTFVAIDEFQNWITLEDTEFLATVRSSPVVFHYLTSLMSGMIAAVAG